MSPNFKKILLGLKGGSKTQRETLLSEAQTCKSRTKQTVDCKKLIKVVKKKKKTDTPVSTSTTANGSMSDRPMGALASGKSTIGDKTGRLGELLDSYCGEELVMMRAVVEKLNRIN